MTSVRPHLPALTGLVLKLEKPMPTRLLQQLLHLQRAISLSSAVAMTCCCFATSTHMSSHGLAAVVMLNAITYWLSKLIMAREVRKDFLIPPDYGKLQMITCALREGASV